jgi:ketosteroid isomerase-like protein
MGWRVLVAQLVVAVFMAAAAMGPAAAQQSSEIAAVQAANDAFDKALSERDLAALEKLWVRDASAMAVHPNSKRVVVGWNAIRKTWEETTTRFSELSVAMKEPNIRIEGGVAWVVGIEEVTGKRQDGQLVGFAALTTNIFEKRGDAWLMVFHHASRVPQ